MGRGGEWGGGEKDAEESWLAGGEGWVGFWDWMGVLVFLSGVVCVDVDSMCRDVLLSSVVVLSV